MAACPWCKATVGDLLAPCPRCGRRSDEQAAMTGGGDVPDLDIPARAPKAPQAAAPVARPRPAAPAPAAARRSDDMELTNNAFNDPGARTLENDSDDLSGGSLDLDLAGPPLIPDGPGAPKAPSQSMRATQSTQGKGVAGAVAPPPGAGTAANAPPAPLARARKSQDNREQSAVDPYEARALADYGDPPAEWWKTPLYAYRVLRRRPELKKIADQKKREAERAIGAAEDALVSFAEVVRPAAERLGAYAGAFESVRATERVLGERDAILASETAAHKQRQAEIDAKLAELEAQLAQIQVEERQISGEHAEADTLLKRADARAKRIEIEMRSAVAQAQGEAGDGAKGPGP
ncbi:MAG: hypothetical protein ACLQVI_04535 [Polyangiaceae bacterium]